MVTIADDLDAAKWAVRAAEWDPRVFAAVALHPTRAQTLTGEARHELERLAAHPRVVAIGETGLDLYWPGKLDGCADPVVQRDAFAWHIDLAKEGRQTVDDPQPRRGTTKSSTSCRRRAPRTRSSSTVSRRGRRWRKMSRQRLDAELVRHGQLQECP